MKKTFSHLNAKRAAHMVNVGHKAVDKTMRIEGVRVVEKSKE